MDEALANRDVSAAVRASHEAYLAALGSRRWEGMVEVGDAYLRIGAASASRQPAGAEARQAYLYALLRARHAGSVDGALRTAEAFAALNDREASVPCLRAAERLADRFVAADSRP